MTAPLIEMIDIVKDFPGVRALNRVRFHANKGEVLALVGENGAGKSTLMKVLSGVWPHGSYEGEIHLRGELAKFQTTRDAEHAGIAIIHQELNLIPELTVGENIFLNRMPSGKFGVIDWDRVFDESAKTLAQIGVQISPRTLVRELTIGKQQMVEIAKALSINAEILILDEPTSALSDREVADLFTTLRGLKERGVAMIYISHKMDELKQIADKVCVLRDGASIGEVEPIAGLKNEEIIARMVGRNIEDMYPRREPNIGTEILRVEKMNVEKRVHDVDFTLARGEVLGMTGLMGAGRTELVEAVFGARAATGSIFVDGQKIEVRAPADAIRAGIGLVTEDRKLLGLVLGMSVRENITLAVLDSLSNYWVIDRLEERKIAAEMSQKLHVKAPSVEARVGNLSGGNQQKVVLAKWLLSKPKVLILDEPTRGIDVGAKVEIYHLINELARSGVGIIVISSELPEVMGLSDRILVMHEGKKVAELTRDRADAKRIMSYATLGRAPEAQA